MPTPNMGARINTHTHTHTHRVITDTLNYNKVLHLPAGLKGAVLMRVANNDFMI